jgi:polyphosphate kinase
MKRLALDSPRCYLTRYAEWLELNPRELEQTRDIGNRPFERVKFLPIKANNMDEFVEAPVSSFLQRIEKGFRDIYVDGLTPKQELTKTTATMYGLVSDHYRCWTSEFVPMLAIDPVASPSIESETQVSANAAV